MTMMFVGWPRVWLRLPRHSGIRQRKRALQFVQRIRVRRSCSQLESAICSKRSCIGVSYT
jgi:hypothetical protein